MIAVLQNFVFATLILCTASFAEAGIHSAPIIVPGFKIPQATRYPISTYRVFKTNAKGEASLIPFQIDEINRIGDYILDQGSDVNRKDSNGIFDPQDELAFMGDDVGPAITPKIWRLPKPSLLYEVKLELDGTNPTGDNIGAVYLGIYFSSPAPLSSKNYVVFNPAKGQVETSRYIYNFDQQNYLVVNGVDMKPDGSSSSPIRLIDSSTFYLKADLKYFLTLELFHRDVESKLEAFKVGPVRTIVRVTFFYRVLRMNFELGMYTEVSLFSNAVLLPAIMYNPIDGEKSLNAGSSFYYGFAITKDPSAYKIATNIPTYKEQSALLDIFKREAPPEPLYWMTLTGPSELMYFEVIPSREMLAKNNVPRLYTEDATGETLKGRPNDRASALGKSPVNMALSFDLTKFREGEQKISFRLFFENRYDPKVLESFKRVNDWRLLLTRVTPP